MCVYQSTYQPEYPSITAVSLGAAVADAVAVLRTDEEKETLVIAGGALLLDGLLAAAGGSSRGEERDAAERAVLNLLATGAPRAQH